MEFGFTTAAYIVAAILFILSLGGLSGQESAKRAVWYGIVGMAIAVLATLMVRCSIFSRSAGRSMVARTACRFTFATVFPVSIHLIQFSFMDCAF